MSGFRNCFLQWLVLAVFAIGLSGCAAAPLAVGAAAGLGGKSLYDAKHDNPEENLEIDVDVPETKMVYAGVSRCRSLVLESLLEDGEEIEINSKEIIKTKQKKIRNGDYFGKKHVFSTKTVFFEPISSSKTEITVQVKLFSDSIYTAKKEESWGKMKALERKKLFDKIKSL